MHVRACLHTSTPSSHPNTSAQNTKINLRRHRIRTYVNNLLHVVHVSSVVPHDPKRDSFCLSCPRASKHPKRGEAPVRGLAHVGCAQMRRNGVHIVFVHGVHTIRRLALSRSVLHRSSPSRNNATTRWARLLAITACSSKEKCVYLNLFQLDYYIYIYFKYIHLFINDLFCKFLFCTVVDYISIIRSP